MPMRLRSARAHVKNRAVIRLSKSSMPAGALARAAVGVAFVAATCAPIEPRAQQLAALADLSLEQLSDIVVTSASRREQRLADSPSSIYVITSDDIRRAGVRTLPEALRLAPNLQVARADANQYAITARGFGNVLANRLLVMIDGRTVYSPLFSGVFWEARDIMLEDIERIEVLDGPQTTLWGTNAVNGVINVITKAAVSTQGTLLAIGGGNVDRVVAARHGAATANGGHWRVYARAIEVEDTQLPTRVSTEDESKRYRIGFRYDGPPGQDSLTIQGDAYSGDIDQGAGGRDIKGGNVLARWQRTFGNGDAITVQAYYDRTELDQRTFRDRLDTFDVDVQARVNAGPRNLLIVGGGYRHYRDRVDNGPLQAFLPPDRNLDILYGFVQDEFAVDERISLIGGLKVEHNDYTGVEYLPNVRVRWQAATDHMVWGAISRSVRTPSRIDRELFLPGQPPFSLAGGPSFRSEVANVFELGARGRLLPHFTYSVTAFHHIHQRMRSLEPSGTGAAEFRNGIEGDTSGIEAWVTYLPFDRWRLSAGGVHMTQDLHPRPGVVDLGGVAALGNDPRNSFVARSTLDFGERQELDIIVRHVGKRPFPAVPSYTAVDLRWGWHVTRNVEVSLTLENLTDRRHSEWGNRVEFERAAYLKLLVQL
jgi:iron complex outermembrane receptor protein